MTVGCEKCRSPAPVRQTPPYRASSYASSLSLPGKATFDGEGDASDAESFMQPRLVGQMRELSEMSVGVGPVRKDKGFRFTVIDPKWKQPIRVAKENGEIVTGHTILGMLRNGELDMKEHQPILRRTTNALGALLRCCLMWFGL
uniref:Uncharacterized protein n=1 Tax=Lotharella globosa TaxID=91324 RepID=A0A7S3Z6T9_9EUKA